MLFVSSLVLLGFGALPFMGIVIGIFLSMSGVGAIIGFPMIVVSSIMLCCMTSDKA